MLTPRLEMMTRFVAAAMQGAMASGHYDRHLHTNEWAWRKAEEMVAAMPRAAKLELERCEEQARFNEH